MTTEALPFLTLPRVAASLQLMLAARRAARAAEHALRQRAIKGL